MLTSSLYDKQEFNPPDADDADDADLSSLITGNQSIRKNESTSSASEEWLLHKKAEKENKIRFFYMAKRK